MTVTVDVKLIPRSARVRWLTCMKQAVALPVLEATMHGFLKVDSELATERTMPSIRTAPTFGRTTRPNRRYPPVLLTLVVLHSAELTDTTVLTNRTMPRLRQC